MICVPVNVNGAGEGILEVTVMTATCGAVPHTIKTVGNGVHCVTFVPESAEPHSAMVKFNGEPVTGIRTATTDILTVVYTSVLISSG